MRRGTFVRAPILSIGLVFIVVGSLGLQGCRPGARGSTGVATLNASLSTGSDDLAMTGASALMVGNSSSYTISGGIQPYSATMTSGSGSVSGNSLSYTAPGSSGTSTITVTDADGTSVSMNVSIADQLAVTPYAQGLIVGQSRTFTTTGGVGSITLSVSSVEGTAGSFSGTTYNSTGGSSFAYVVGVATDDLGNTANFYIGHVGSPSIHLDGANLDGSYNSTLTHNDDVNTWEDSSTNDNDATAIGAGQRAHYASDSGSTAALGSLVFRSAQSDCMTVPETVNTVDASVVVSYNTSTANGYIYSDDGANGAMQLFQIYHTGSYLRGVALDLDAVNHPVNRYLAGEATTSDDGAWHLGMWVLDADSAATLYSDGASADGGSPATYDPATTFEGQTGGNPGLGGLAGCGSQFYDGAVGDMLLYPGVVLSSTERDRLGCYFERKYDLDVSGLTCN